MSGIWIEDKDAGLFLTDPRHPLVRAELEDYLRRNGMRYDEPLNEQQRRNFERAILEKYSELFPPPARTPWVPKTWAILEQAAAKEL